MGIATLVPSGMFWSAIARITKSPKPSVSDAKAVPIARPSGRLCTSSTAKTSTERRTPAPVSCPTWTSRASRARRETSRNTTPTTSPAATAAADPSSRAGSSSPTIDATVISPTVSPQSAGRRVSACAPSRETGSAPSPVARAVPLAASASTASSIGGPTRPARGRARSGPAPSASCGRSCVGCARDATRRCAR